MNEKQVALLEETAKEVSVLLQSKEKSISTAIRLAKGMKELEKSFKGDKEFISILMSLQGSSLGFRTDKDSSNGYPEKVVADCALEATLRGLLLHDNQFNIIAGRTYITKNGMRHLLDNIQELTDLEISLGTPQLSGEEAKVRCKAKWKMNGVIKEMGTEDDPCIILVRVNKFMGSDAILGKVERKLYARIYQRVTGRLAPEGEAEDVPLTRNVTPDPDLIEHELVQVDSKEEGEQEELKKPSSPAKQIRELLEE